MSNRVAASHCMNPHSLDQIRARWLAPLVLGYANSFCKSHGFDLDPTPRTVAYFIVYTCRYIKPASVASYLSGIQAELIMYYPHVTATCHSTLVQRALRGRRRYGSAVHGKRPLDLSDFEHLYSIYHSPATHDDLLFIALTTSGFSGLNRLGELVQPDHKHLRAFRRCSLRHTVRWYTGAYGYHLPVHKADPFYEGNRLVLSSTVDASDPYRPFIAYLYSRDKLFPLLPHLWLCSTGHPPTRSWFMTRLRSLFPVDVAGHSLRAGGATALALAGATNDHIRAAGRWSSDAFQIYVRKNPILLHALLNGRSIAPSGPPA
jgi:hypothetical protein